ncbi:MAG: hypothetical protein PHE26_07030 [Syntrophomonadaceae bacterium]|nr:hypothetical protein [Syntrophomonadaceae bacterium]
MNSPIKREIVAHFSGISTSSYKGYRIQIDLFTDELLIKAPDHSSGISYKFDSFSQISIEHRQAAKQEDILDIKINYPGKHSEFESIIIQREDIEQILNRYRLYKEKVGKPQRTDFEQVKETKTVALVEFNKEHDVKNYNYGTLLLSTREINFLSYNGKNFILHLDQLDDSFYYQAVVLTNDILGYSRWVSIHKVSERENGSSEIVTFLTDDIEAQYIEQLLSKHYEKFFTQKLSKIQDQWLVFNKKVEGYYSLLSGDPEMLSMSSDFAEKNKQILINADSYFQFEHFLKTICYQSQIGLLPSTEFEISSDLSALFKNEFINFVKDISEKYNFENPDVAIFTVWKVLKHIAFEGYSANFTQLYSQHFDQSEILDDYLASYTNLQNEIEITSSHNIALFTYYLMKNYWKNEDNFAYYYHTIEQEIIKDKEAQE